MENKTINSFFDNFPDLTQEVYYKHKNLLFSPQGMNYKIDRKIVEKTEINYKNEGMYSLAMMFNKELPVIGEFNNQEKAEYGLRKAFYYINLFKDESGVISLDENHSITWSNPGSFPINIYKKQLNIYVYNENMEKFTKRMVELVNTNQSININIKITSSPSPDRIRMEQTSFFGSTNLFLEKLFMKEVKPWMQECFNEASKDVWFSEKRESYKKISEKIYGLKFYNDSSIDLTKNGYNQIQIDDFSYKNFVKMKYKKRKNVDVSQIIIDLSKARFFNSKSELTDIESRGFLYLKALDSFIDKYNKVNK